MHPVITLDMTLDRRSAHDVLCAILHSILFHRLFGTIKPRTFEVLDVTMPGVADQEMERLITDRVDTLCNGIDDGVDNLGQIIVTFSETQAKKSWLPIYAGEEDVTWEQWIVNVKMLQSTDDEDSTFNFALSSALSKSLQTILKHISSERGRTAVPLITTSVGISPFPLKITAKVGGVELHGGDPGMTFY